MKRALLLGMLLASVALAGCATAIIGGGGQSRCQESNQKNCDK